MRYCRPYSHPDQSQPVDQQSAQDQIGYAFDKTDIRKHAMPGHRDQDTRRHLLGQADELRDYKNG